jgi:Glycosyl transferases group 1
VRVLVYPADRSGCGYHRLIWPAEELRRQGHDVVIMDPSDRRLEMSIDTITMDVLDIKLPRCDVVVLQRVAHRYIASAISAMRERGVAVVVDVDDNLNEIHPLNPAFGMLHPANEGRLLSNGSIHRQSWEHLNRACASATVVTVSTQALVPVYGTRGHARVVQNVLADGYYRQEHADGDLIGWPASLHSHPTDPSVTKGRIGRLVEEGARFHVVGRPDGVRRAFKLPDEPSSQAVVDVHDWAREVAKLGIGITPAVASVFNLAKSWLKPLELSAVGVPWVASPIPEYERLHARGAGLIAQTPDDWYRLVGGLLRSPGRRQELAEAGRVVANGLRLRDHAWRWWEAWEEAYRIQRGVRRATVVGTSTGRT